MKKYTVNIVLVLIIGVVAVSYYKFSDRSITIAPGLQYNVFNAVNTKTKGVWNKRLEVTRVDQSGKAVEGKWVAKDYWDWIAWQDVSGTWKVLVSLDGFDCGELKNIPDQYTSFFHNVTYEEYCYSH